MGVFPWSQICWCSAPLGTGRGSGALAGASGVLLPLGLIEDRGAEGSRAGTACGLREEPAGQNHPQSTHNHAGCCRTIQLCPSDPAPTHGAEHKAPMDRGWGQLCEAGVTVCGEQGVPARPARRSTAGNRPGVCEQRCCRVAPASRTCAASCCYHHSMLRFIDGSLRSQHSEKGWSAARSDQSTVGNSALSSSAAGSTGRTKPPPSAFSD